MRLSALAMVFGFIAVDCAAEPVTLQGVTFSDELGGIEITGGYGSGTRDDPFVIVEDIFDEGPAILVVHGLDRHFGNYTGSSHVAGFTLVKTATNRTTKDWYGFEMELRERTERTSNYGDGLSFGQAIGDARVYAADRFAEVYQTDEPLDAVIFYDGLVRPGESVTMRVVITDFSPSRLFYLLQRRNAPLAQGKKVPDRG
ncbi:MAG: hypothetical protein AAFY56_04595 [Pseudomonadota bacterium]